MVVCRYWLDDGDDRRGCGLDSKHDIFIDVGDDTFLCVTPLLLARQQDDDDDDVCGE